jgi:hypothetical protein
LSGLNNLQSTGGSISIRDNSSLSDLTDLMNINSVEGNLSIRNNDSLKSLAGLDNVIEGSINDLSIYDNGSLSDCEVNSICMYLLSPNGTVEIHDNAPGCNSPEEVEAACEVGIGESSVDSRQSAVSIYPNPSSTQITIETPKTTSKFLISIFNLNGQEVINQKLTAPGTSIDISNLPQGIYCVRLTSDNIVKVLKIIKE